MSNNKVNNKTNIKVKSKKNGNKKKGGKSKKVSKKQKGGNVEVKESDENRSFLNTLKMTNTNDSKELEKKAEGTPYYPGPMPIPDCTIM